MAWDLKRRTLVKVQDVEAVRRHIVVTLPPDVPLATAHEDPQLLFGQKLNRGDLVDLVAGDGSAIWYACAVKSNVGGVYLDKPMKITALEESSLYSDAHYAVVPVGDRYAVQHKRGGHLVSDTFTTAKAAEAELHRRYPQQVA